MTNAQGRVWRNLLWLLIGCGLALRPNAVRSDVAPATSVTPTPQPTPFPAVEVSAATLAADQGGVNRPEELEQFCRDMDDICGRGHWDEVVARVTPILDKLPAPDQRLAYYRGRAAYEIGSYALVTRDLAPLGDYAPLPRWRWQPASKYATRVEALRRLCPPHVYDMSFGDKVIFRVYYDEDDAWTRAIIGLLPQAYRVNRKLLGELRRPRLIFRTMTLQAVLRTRSQGHAPGSWVWAAGNSGLLYFCEASATARPRRPR